MLVFKYRNIPINKNVSLIYATKYLKNEFTKMIFFYEYLISPVKLQLWLLSFLKVDIINNEAVVLYVLKTSHEYLAGYLLENGRDDRKEEDR